MLDKSIAQQEKIVDIVAKTVVAYKAGEITIAQFYDTIGIGLGLIVPEHNTDEDEEFYADDEEEDWNYTDEEEEF